MVVAVKNNNIESNKINLLIVAYEFSTTSISTKFEKLNTAKDHESDEIDGLIRVLECSGGVKHQWYTENSKNRVEDTHKDVIEFFGINLPRFEFKRSIVPSKITRKTNQHFSKWWMHLFTSISQYQKQWGGHTSK
jgi:hypothetical protein